MWAQCPRAPGGRDSGFPLPGSPPQECSTEAGMARYAHLGSVATRSLWGGLSRPSGKAALPSAQVVPVAGACVAVVGPLADTSLQSGPAGQSPLPCWGTQELWGASTDVPPGRGVPGSGSAHRHLWVALSPPQGPSSTCCPCARPGQVGLWPGLLALFQTRPWDRGWQAAWEPAGVGSRPAPSSVLHCRLWPLLSWAVLTWPCPSLETA